LPIQVAITFSFHLPPNVFCFFYYIVIFKGLSSFLWRLF
jgi:hypothetical protein